LIATELFKKLGLRYVLVSHHGKLVGIITKKDMLQFAALRKHHKVLTFANTSSA